MSDRTTVMYYYDGTYNGFLSCVFESFAEKETPAAILPVDEADQTCLFGAKYIETDLRRAERVRVFELGRVFLRDASVSKCRRIIQRITT